MRIPLQFPALRVAVLVAAVLSAILGCADPWSGGSPVPPDDPQIRYVGRVDHRDPAAPRLVWPGTRIEVFFDGTGLAARFRDLGNNYLNVTVDGGAPRVVEPSRRGRLLVLADGLAPGPHTVTVSKRTERQEGPLVFLGLEVAGTLTEPPPRPDLRIEFFGDSITSGYAVDADCDCADADGKDHDKTYAALTARALRAEHHATSVTGIGLVHGYEPDLMFDAWDNLDPNDPADSLWDFTSWVPQVVVINLGQNDVAHGVPAEEMHRAWVDFAGLVRGHYPEAELFLVLGQMSAVQPGSPYPKALERAVEDLRQAGDTRVHGMTFDWPGYGGHPKAEDNRRMADKLTAFLRPWLPPSARDSLGPSTFFSGLW